MLRPTPDVIFVNRFFWPDHSATAQILSDVAQRLVRDGFRVRIITSRMLYSDNGQDLPTTENWEGVEISRVWTSRFGRDNLIGRALDYLTFYVSAFFSVLRHADRASIVISKTDPPLIGVPVGFAARLKGGLRGNWFQDVYPEIAETYGLKLGRSLVDVLRWARNRSIRKAAVNVGIGERMAAQLQADAKPSKRIEVIHNFSDDDSLRPGVSGVADLRREWGFTPADFVIGYSGNLGRAHDVQTILDAADALQDQSHIKFLFVGGGRKRALVEDACAIRKLTNIAFRPYQPRDQIPISLNVPDLHWISLKPEFEGLIVPSKIYGIAAVGKPVLMIGSEDGEIGKLIATFGFGVTIAPGDSARAVIEIERLSRAEHVVKDMCNRSRFFIDAVSSKEAALKRWHHVLKATART